jgi:hypothetical protein
MPIDKYNLMIDKLKKEREKNKIDNVSKRVFTLKTEEI